MEADTLGVLVSQHVYGFNVLFVDDSSDERDLFPMRFGECFGRLVTVGSVEEALDELWRGDTELVVTELGLPDYDGFELVTRMRAMPSSLGAVPVVAVTGLSATTIYETALASGFAGYVTKPYEGWALLSVVARLEPSMQALHDLRARCREQIFEQKEVRARLVAWQAVVREQRARLALRYGSPDQREAATRVIVEMEAGRFVECYFGDPADEVEIATTRLLADDRESWVVVAVSRGELVLVEVVVGPAAEVVVRWLDSSDDDREAQR